MENPPVVDHFLGTPWVFHIYVSDFQGVSKHLGGHPHWKGPKVIPMDESAFFQLFPGLPRLTFGFTAKAADVHRVSKVC